MRCGCLGWFENKNIENTQRDFSKDKRYFIIDNINVNLLLFKVCISYDKRR